MDAAAGLRLRHALHTVDAAFKLQVGQGDRSEKIRTYNFPQSRVTDHRIGFTVHNINAVMGGDLDDIVKALCENEQKELMEKLGQD